MGSDEVAKINHNTFVNSSGEINYSGWGNNTSFTNNLFVNMGAAPETRNSNSQINALQFDFKNGHGKIAARYQQECPEDIGNRECWDNNNRNITVPKVSICDLNKL